MAAAARLLKILFIFCLTADYGNTAINYKKREFNVKVNESIALNSTVFRLPIDDSTATVEIERGNKNNRFNVTFEEDSWEIRLQHLLDYNICHRFHLVIVMSSSEQVDKFTVNVDVNEISGWPPYFNRKCSNTFPNFTVPSSGVKSPWAFDAKITLDAPFIGKADYYLSEFDEPQDVQFDIDNDDCNIKTFAVATYNNHTLIDVKSILDQFNPEKDVICTTLSGGNKIPEIKLWKDRMLPVNKYINPEWLEQTPGSFAVIIGLEFKHVQTEEISGWLCSINPHLIGIVNTTLEVIPTGCELNRYGGQCQFQCVCENGATCHPFNGACQCAPGWISPDCTISTAAVDITPKLQSFKYGDRLELKCQLYHMNSTGVVFEWSLNDVQISSTRNITVKNTKSSSTLTVMHFSDDDGGIYKCVAYNEAKLVSQDMAVTFDGCHDGLWGEKCDKICGCEHNGVCQRFKGCICTDYHERWGETCDKVCYCEGNSTCHEYEGFCQCEEWEWGHLCQHRCDCGGGADRCLPSDGECVCRLGWSGERCDFDLKRPAFIIGMIFTGLVLLIVAIVVAVRYYRRHYSGYTNVHDRKLLVTSADNNVM